MRTVSVIIPAYNAQQTIAATVRAAAAIPRVCEVIVVDDGSADPTASAAESAGAQVLRLPRNQGKGAALRRGLQEASGDLVLFLDADLGESAALATALVEPVARDDAEMAIAHFEQGSGARDQGLGKNEGGRMSYEVKEGDSYNSTDSFHPSSFILHPCSPPAPGPRPLAPASKGGFGLTVGLARWGIRMLTGLKMQSPLSGQRCLPRALAEQVGIADRFGVEVGLTLEVFRRGGRILEIPLPMKHRATGRTVRGFSHRGRQFFDALVVLLAAAYGIGGTAIGGRRLLLRGLKWILAVCAVAWACAYLPIHSITSVFASLGAALFLTLALHLILSVTGRFKDNYAGRRMHDSFGLLFPPVWLIGQIYSRARDLYPVALMLLLTWALLGLLDDVYGSHGARGFRGHIRALLKMRPTTGGAKLLLGGGASLLAGWLISRGDWPSALLNGLIIALCTNFLNLLDLRPGRALKGFSLLAILACAFNSGTALLLVPLFIAAVVYAPLDLGARAMMGDVGSNTLGAMVGLSLTLSLGVEDKLALLLLLLVVHIYAEIGSLSTLIDRIPLLRWLDRLGRAED